MTATEIYKAVLQELNYQETTTITPEEFNHHIWVAELEYVKTRYMAYERAQKTIDDLRVLKVTTDGIAGMPTPLLPNGTIANAQWVVLPENYFRLTAVAVVAKYYGEPCKKDGTLSEPIPCRFLADDQAHLTSKSYYMKPAAQYPRLYYVQRGNTLVFKAGTSLVHYAIINYLRYPARIRVDDNGQSLVDSEFLDEQNYELVKWCVASYLEKIEEMRMQSLRMMLNDSFEYPNVQQTPPIQ
jgi:hypothetical protein